MADFTSLESLNRMLSATDFVGSLRGNIGRGYATGAVDARIVEQITGLIVNSKTDGAFSSASLIAKINELLNGASAELKKQFHEYFTVFSTAGDLDGERDGSKASIVAGNKIEKTPVTTIIGTTTTALGSRNVTIFLSKTPYVQPAHRNVGAIETFANTLPSSVVSAMIPYLDVQFTFDRPGAGIDALRAPGAIKFLAGAAPIATNDRSATGIIVNSTRTNSTNTNGDISQTVVAGMEMFTSPQTLVNPETLGESQRYVDVIDKFRPFATIKSFDINVNPTVGLYTYKTGKLTLILHDRSRLSEISDLVKPEVYTRTTMWITYGWKCPDDPKNSYFDFINKELTTRELYAITNASFTFEQSGGVNIVLELHTKGISEMNDTRITDDDKQMKSIMKKITDTVQDIKSLRIAMGLQAPEGSSKEIRFFKLLAAAEAGEWPDLSDPSLLKSVEDLHKTLVATTAGSKVAPNTGNVDKLISDIKSLYETVGSGKDKQYAFQQRKKTQATEQLRLKFAELSGADPYLPTKENTPDSPMIPLIESFNKESTGSSLPEFKRAVCSFGKLFSVFAIRGIIDQVKSVDDIQVFFYSLNHSCGPASSTNIASFPVDLQVFMDNYRSLIVSSGGEHITMKQFIQVAVNSQFLDPRSIAYGHRKWYQPYNPKEPEAKLLDKSSAGYESAIAAESVKNGPFIQPSIEFLVETLGERVDPGTVISSKKIIKIHIYDKTNNPHHAAGAILQDTDGSLIEVPATDYAKKITGSDGALTSPTMQVAQQQLNTQILQDVSNGTVKLSGKVSAASIKQIVASLVPTFTFGSNGSTISSATVTSQHDALLSTTQMIKSNARQNTTQPNGANSGNLPLLIIPVSVNITMLGCPLIMPAQTYFIDFNTGTTVDNLYIVTGLQHIISAGKFDTILTLSFYDAYGKYRSAQNITNYIEQQLPGLKSGATTLYYSYVTDTVVIPRDAPLCISPRLSGTRDWILVQQRTYQAVKLPEPRPGCWTLDIDTGVSYGTSGSLNDLFRLNGLEVDLAPPELWRKIAASVTYTGGDTPRPIRWDALMPPVEHEAWLKRLTRDVHRNLGLCDLEYFRGVWSLGNAFLGSLLGTHVDSDKINFLLERGVPPHHFKGFITFNGQCERVVYDRFGTRTGRLGVVSGPHVHSFPKKLRGLLRPSSPQKRLWCADVSALEPQLLAYLGGSTLPEVDIYDDINRLIFADSGVSYPRASIKEGVICEMYGSGIPRLAEALNISTSEASMIMSHTSRYIGSSRLKRSLITECSRSDSRGLSIKNHYGRRCAIDEPLPHILLNTFAQSTGADVSLLLFKQFVQKWDVTPLFTIYDAVYYECDASLEFPEVESLIVDGFSQPFRLKIAPLPRI